MQRELNAGQDSFLDIVANLVGIMIILLVIVGARASQGGPDVAHDQDLIEKQQEALNEIQQQIVKSQTAVEKLRHDNRDQYQQIEKENQLAAEYTVRRHQMLMEIELLKQATVDKEKKLAVRLASWEEEDKQRQAKQVSFQRELAKLERELNDAKQQLSAIDSNIVVRKDETIEHYPNPIARTVFSKELHFRLANGKISFVPMEELIELMKAEWKLKAEKLSEAPRTIETVGPVDGFRLQYELGLETVRERTEFGMIDRNVIQFRRFVIVPVAGSQGEAIEVALQEGSRFRAKLGQFNPEETTVSVWVYPDGFDEHSQLKRWLHESRYQMASWPLLPGRPISGGPNGLKTSAQ